MPRASRILQLLFALLTAGAIPVLQAHARDDKPTAAALLTQARKATGGDAWNHIAELRIQGTALFNEKTSGTIAIVDDLRTGANAARIEIEGRRVKNQASTPAQSWEQDNAGEVLLTPGGKKPSDIDDLYIHRNGWWRPGFDGATILLLSPATEDGLTYERLQCNVSGGNGFTLWIDRTTHRITRIVAGDSVTSYSDFRPTESGLILPFREKKTNGKNTNDISTTTLTALPQLNPADLQPPFHTDYSIPASGEVTVPAKGGLIFKMKINGQAPIDTIFDTGGLNVLSAALAEQLGLKVDTAPVRLGAIGGATAAHVAHVDTLTIGDLVLRNQTFYVISFPPGSNAPELAVGWELMRRFAVRIDFQHQQLTFFDGPHFRYTGPGIAVPLILNKNGNGAEVRAFADGIPATLTVDSGNEIGLFLTSGIVDKNHLVATLGARYKGYNGKGYGGDSSEAWFARLHTLRLGDVEIADPVVRLQTQFDGMYTDDGNIGQNILRRFTVIMDCMRGVMVLEKTEASNKREIFNRAGLVFDPVDGVDNIKTVLPSSAASLAGLKPGDRIISINGQKPADDLNDPVFTQPAGTILHLGIQRNGIAKIYDITLQDVL